MTQAPVPIAKRTKQELLEEYEKMQDQLEELRSTAKMVHSQPALDLVEKTKAKTPQAIDKVFADFQASLHTHLMDVRASLLEQSATLQDFQKAIELSKQQLNLQNRIALAADSLDQLVDEQTRRTAVFEIDIEKRKRDHEEQILLKKKIWERETEEYEYQKKLKGERDRVETEEREKALAARETALRAQEQEIAQIKKAVEQFPKELETALVKREQETTRQLTQQFAHEKALMEKETGSQVRLLELTVKNLEERLLVSVQEVVSLKQQTEEANTKAQVLAMKAIERPTTVVTSANPTTVSQPSYHDRQQGRE